MSRLLVAQRALTVPGWAKDALWRRAQAIPSLDLRFADNKSLVDATTGSNLVTFTRASSGTYVGSDGVLRTAVTNLLLRSEEFDTTWTAERSSVSSDQAIAPNGTLSADTLIEDTSVALSHVLSQASLSVVSGSTYTFSCYAKRASGTRDLTVTLRSAQFGTNMRATVDLSTGVVTPAGSPVGSGSTPMGNGWWRVWVTATATVSAATTVGINLTSGTTLSYTGDGTSGIYLWGAQLEQSATVGEYIPTTSTINSAPRFDHNPTTGESLGLLVEEQRTNLLVRSEEFDDASWAKANVTVQENAALAPNGSTLADKLIASATTTVHNINQIVTASSAAYTFSIYLKAAELTTASIRAGRAGNFVNADINLSLGTIAPPSQIGTATNGSSSIQRVSNDWYRCSVTGSNLGDGQINAIIYIPDDATLPGDGTSGIYLWGAQLEAGAFPTSYIPTTAAAVTRSADVASITGSAFTSFYNQSENTTFIDTTSVGSNIGFTFVISDGTDNNRNGQYKTGSAVTNRLVLAGAQNNAGSISYTPPQLRVRSLVSAQAGSTIMCVNGTLGSASTQSPLPTVDRITIGSGALGTNFLGGTIRRLTYWPQRLANSTLQQITQ